MMPTRPFLLAVVAALLGMVVGVIGVVGLAAADTPQQRRAPADDTIVSVEGDKAHGFTIRYLDGSALFPPTASESRAECREYDTRVARVRCRTEVRVWFRDLGDLKRALAHAHRQ